MKYFKRLLRRIFQCSLGIHWQVKYKEEYSMIDGWDCEDCGFHQAPFKIPPPPPCKEPAEFPRIVMNRDQLKEICTDFYYWWHNQPGANTQQGFDDWMKTTGVKQLQNL